jgi:hypothetical protein
MYIEIGVFTAANFANARRIGNVRDFAQHGYQSIKSLNCASAKLSRDMLSCVLYDSRVAVHCTNV